MKKLFASLMAATMVAGMSVSAFAYVGTNDKAPNNTVGNENEATNAYEADDDFGFDTLTGGKTVYGGDKMYAPILVDVAEADDDAENVATGEYYYATKSSEVEDLKVSFKETEGKGSIKEANIVRKDASKFGVSGVSGKIYGIEIKLNDYFKTEESELEFDLTLKEKGKEQLKVEDIYYTLGKDDELPEKGKDENKMAGYEAKFKNDLLELTVGADTKAVTLDEWTDGDKIEELYMETADGEMIVEGKLEEQDALFLGFEADPTDFQKAVMTENDKADVEIMNWVARPTFDFNMDVTVPVDEDEDNFLYEEIDGKLVEVEAKLNDDGDELTFKTKTLGKYLLSDMELTAEKAEKEDVKEDAKEEATEKEDGKKESPETGASLVAVATAIALF